MNEVYAYKSAAAVTLRRWKWRAEYNVMYIQYYIDDNLLHFWCSIAIVFLTYQILSPLFY